jgi:hypothetical protein
MLETGFLETVDATRSPESVLGDRFQHARSHTGHRAVCTKDKLASLIVCGLARMGEVAIFKTRTGRLVCRSRPVTLTIASAFNGDDARGRDVRHHRSTD